MIVLYVIKVSEKEKLTYQFRIGEFPANTEGTGHMMRRL